MGDGRWAMGDGRIVRRLGRGNPLWLPLVQTRSVEIGAK
jgi:hypothetical protein